MLQSVSSVAKARIVAVIQAITRFDLSMSAMAILQQIGHRTGRNRQLIDISLLSQREQFSLNIPP
jgi:predicted MarR family transcription regulator